MATSSSKGIALVSGASGFIAGVLIDHLLSLGYQVRGTVRSIADKTKLDSFFEHFDGAIKSKQLQLFEADLLKEGSFEEAVKGVDYVFHTASPFQLTVTDPQRQFIDPAVNGTKNILKSAFAEPSVKKIIVTSSFAAIKGADKSSPYDESDWNEVSTLETSPYRLSKTLAEKAAWQLLEEHKKAGGNKELIAINPAWVFGPASHKRNGLDSESQNGLISLFSGKWKDGAPAFEFCTVDVRDVVEAHIRAAEYPNAHGRYLVLSHDSSNPLIWSSVIAKLYPSVKDRLPTTIQSGQKLPAQYFGSNAKVEKDLGIKVRPLEEMIKAAADKLIQFGIIKL